METTKAITIKNMMERLAGTAIGHTRVIAGVPVTRWTAQSYEVGTWGKATVTLQTAAEMLTAAQGGAQ